MYLSGLISLGNPHCQCPVEHATCISWFSSETYWPLSRPALVGLQAPKPHRAVCTPMEERISDIEDKNLERMQRKQERGLSIQKWKSSMRTVWLNQKKQYENYRYTRRRREGEGKREPIQTNSGWELPKSMKRTRSSNPKGDITPSKFNPKRLMVLKLSKKINEEEKIGEPSWRRR